MKVSGVFFYSYVKFSTKISTNNKKRDRYKHRIDRFKIVANNDIRKMSNIVENLSKSAII